MEILLLAIASFICFLIFKKLTEPKLEEDTFELPIKFHTVGRLPDHGIPGHWYILQSENKIFMYNGEDYIPVGDLQKGE